MKTLICWILEKAWRVAKKLGLLTVCFTFYEGECWNRCVGVMTEGSRVREEELYEKARAILMESPEGAPLSEVWLVYDQLRYRLGKQPEFVKELRKRQLRSRRWHE
jgi:hypothetical protein